MILKLLNSFFLFILLFSKVKKWNISAVYKSIILFFSVNIPLVIIYNKGEPWEHHWICIVNILLHLGTFTYLYWISYNYMLNIFDTGDRRQALDWPHSSNWITLFLTNSPGWETSDFSMFCQFLICTLNISFVYLLCKYIIL